MAYKRVVGRAHRVCIGSDRDENSFVCSVYYETRRGKPVESSLKELAVSLWQWTKRFRHQRNDTHPPVNDANFTTETDEACREAIISVPCKNSKLGVMKRKTFLISLAVLLNTFLLWWHLLRIPLIGYFTVVAPRRLLRRAQAPTEYCCSLFVPKRATKCRFPHCNRDFHSGKTFVRLARATCCVWSFVRKNSRARVTDWMAFYGGN